jgi:hypothetical protein
MTNVLDSKMNIEANWTTQSGLPAAVVIHPAGHRCGYVGVPESSTHYEQHYDELAVQVHGGLTYSGGNDDYPVERSDTWWFGFDCAHSQDQADPDLMAAEYRKYHDRRISMTFRNVGVIRSLEFCIEQCESLAQQLTRTVQ